jgi:hypothetical protein
MTDKLTNAQLAAKVADASADVPFGSTWRHVKSGGNYVVKGVALTSNDLTPVVVYQGTTFGSSGFTRPAHEFADGRFVRLTGGDE